MLAKSDYRHSAAMRIAAISGSASILALALVVGVIFAPQATAKADSQSDESAVRVLVEVEAPPGDRSDKTLTHRWRSYAAASQDENLAQIFDPKSQLNTVFRDQESVLHTSSGTLDGSVVTANSIGLNLPEGSNLYAKMLGDQLKLRPAEDGSHLEVENGKLIVEDSAQHRRLVATPQGSGTLFAHSRSQHNEATFMLTAKGENGEAIPVKVTCDFVAGVPQDEDEPPHGSNRYKWLGEENEAPGEIKVKMQWIYHTEELRKSDVERSRN